MSKLEKALGCIVHDQSWLHPEMVHYQELHVACITNTQLGALHDDEVGELLHVDEVGSAFLPPVTVNCNVEVAFHKYSDSFVHDASIS